MTNQEISAPKPQIGLHWVRSVLAELEHEVPNYASNVHPSRVIQRLSTTELRCLLEVAERELSRESREGRCDGSGVDEAYARGWNFAVDRILAVARELERKTYEFISETIREFRRDDVPAAAPVIALRPNLEYVVPPGGNGQDEPPRLTLRGHLYRRNDLGERCDNCGCYEGSDAAKKDCPNRLGALRDE